MSADYLRGQIGSGTKPKKINQRPKTLIYRKKSDSEIINENNVEQVVRAKINPFKLLKI